MQLLCVVLDVWGVSWECACCCTRHAQGFWVLEFRECRLQLMLAAGCFVFESKDCRLQRLLAASSSWPPA